MHIPDGYLSPQTTITAIAIMMAVWYLAFRKINLSAAGNSSLIPSIALCSAFSFVIMMFNVPIVGGSSAHAVGAVLVAILIGPYAAIIAISTTLMIQALIFGDGGILAIGINCINMAVIMPIIGYATYKLINGNEKFGSKRNLLAVFISSFLGLLSAALAAAIEMGIQPVLFTDKFGLPMYGFYKLSVTIPAMLISHLIAGPIDGIISMFAISYITKFAPQIITNTSIKKDKSCTKRPNYKPVLLALVLLIILSPIGLIASGTAFGEWNTEEVQNMLGYIPSGMAKASNLWNAILPDYTIPKLGETPLAISIGYISSAIIGVIIISALIMLSSYITKRNHTK